MTRTLYTDAEREHALKTLEEKPSKAYASFTDKFGFAHSFKSFCELRKTMRKLRGDLSIPYYGRDAEEYHNARAVAKAKLLVKQVERRIARQKSIAKCRAQRGSWYDG